MVPKVFEPLKFDCNTNQLFCGIPNATVTDNETLFCQVQESIIRSRRFTYLKHQELSDTKSLDEKKQKLAESINDGHLILFFFFFFFLYIYDGPLSPSSSPSSFSSCCAIVRQLLLLLLLFSITCLIILLLLVICVYNIFHLSLMYAIRTT